MLPKMPERALFTAMSYMAPEGGGGPGTMVCMEYRY